MDDPYLAKRILYRATYRGSQEADRILRQFAYQLTASGTLAELQAFDRLLKCDDSEIFSWLEGIEALPDIHHTALFQRLKNYYEKLHQ